MDSTLWIGLLGVVVLLSGLSDARKYGRKCADIGCLTTEKCVLFEDPCTIGSRGECGSYPSCVKVQQGCEKINCQRGEYCINENGQPRCVPTSYDPKAETSDTSRQSAASVNAAPVPSAPLEPAGVNPARSGYPSGSGYPQTNSNSYPYSRTNSAPVGSGYPASSGYPAPGTAGYPSGSGYPASGTSRYPSGSSYPSYPSSGGASGYPAGSGYPANPTQGGYPDNSVRKSSSNTVNAGYPSSYGQYPQYQSGYPQSGYPQGGYPSQTGYPQMQYPANTYGGQYNPNSQYPQQQQKKPGFFDKVKDIATSVATSYISRAISDKLSGKN